MNIGLLSTAAISPDCALVATFAYGRGLDVWEVASGARRHQFAASSTATVMHHPVVFAPHGRSVRLWLPSARAIRLFELETGRVVVLEHPSVVEVTNFAFSRDGAFVAAPDDGRADNDFGAIVWDARTGVVVCEVRRDVPIELVCFDHAGNLVTATADEVDVWHAASGKNLRRWRHGALGPAAMAYDSDGERFAMGSCDNVARIFRTTDDSPPLVLKHADDVTHVAFDADRILTVDGRASVHTAKGLALCRIGERVAAAGLRGDDVVTVSYGGELVVTAGAATTKR